MFWVVLIKGELWHHRWANPHLFHRFAPRRPRKRRARVEELIESNMKVLQQAFEWHERARSRRQGNAIHLMRNRFAVKALCDHCSRSAQRVCLQITALWESIFLYWIFSVAPMEFDYTLSQIGNNNRATAHSTTRRQLWHLALRRFITETFTLRWTIPNASSSWSHISNPNDWARDAAAYEWLRSESSWEPVARLSHVNFPLACASSSLSLRFIAINKRQKAETRKTLPFFSPSSSPFLRRFSFGVTKKVKEILETREMSERRMKCCNNFSHSSCASISADK